MPIRNPFKRAGGVEVPSEGQPSPAEAGFQNTAVAGSRPVSVKEPAEYKLSEINEGVYLPPSPPLKPSFWHSKSNVSTTSSNHRSFLSETEQFSISRESFDSYRRSFDISGSSPMPDSIDGRPHQSFDARRSFDTRRSLDVRRSRAPPRASLQERRPETAHPATAEEAFEDVGLNDDPKPQPQPQPAKKRGLFARFGDSSSSNHTDGKHEERPSTSHHFNFTGRKRAQSGQGSELKDMPRNMVPKVAVEVPIESR
ncbi:hypothetical protein BDV95DRAFT_611441 [Massariosphaeria phaeospora]|uniref:Uncharacterized protein n=1 Tax=Massariosphaeria phaeospora TaxID=100035 RepID=A0A7C8I1J2_9PLEO|nr:hypothetical protein BDV95DRAFT_611441 [Massariosphaeria phaeospora]